MGKSNKVYNIKALSRELAGTKEKVNQWSIFFEKHHLDELNKLLKILENFNAGKIRLVEIRSKNDMRYVFPEEIRYQIEQNKMFKENFEKLLEDLRESFKSRLSEIEDLEFA